ncbi:hypothetical protein LCGC14_2579390 [marine sediment metagenome]|uniref:Uncharacterized protein n=1 Tax=marine sediment metagenome TaxID=412755 RepID=A0A0F9AET2_9ZZZZ
MPEQQLIWAVAIVGIAVTGLVLGALVLRLSTLGVERNGPPLPRPKPLPRWPPPSPYSKCQGFICRAATAIEPGDALYYDPKTNTVSHIQAGKAWVDEIDLTSQEARDMARIDAARFGTQPPESEGE